MRFLASLTAILVCGMPAFAGEVTFTEKPAVATNGGKTKIYVADGVNRRIVRLNKVYAAEEVCEVK